MDSKEATVCRREASAVSMDIWAAVFGTVGMTAHKVQNGGSTEGLGDVMWANTARDIVNLS